MPRCRSCRLRCRRPRARAVRSVGLSEDCADSFRRCARSLAPVYSLSLPSARGRGAARSTPRRALPKPGLCSLTPARCFLPIPCAVLLVASRLSGLVRAGESRLAGVFPAPVEAPARQLGSTRHRRRRRRLELEFELALGVTSGHATPFAPSSKRRYRRGQADHAAQAGEEPSAAEAEADAESRRFAHLVSERLSPLGRN